MKKNISIRKIVYILCCIYFMGMSLQYANKNLPRLNSIIMYLFVGMTLLYIIIRRKVSISKYCIMYLIFIGMCIIGCFYSPFPYQSMNTLSTTIICFIISCSAAIVISNTKELETLFFLYAAATSILIIILFMQGNITFSTGERFGNELVGNANTFSTIYMIGGCFSAYFLVYKTGIIRLFSSVFFAFQMFAMIIAGGRKFPIVVLFTLWVMLFAKTDKKNRKHYFRYTIIGLIIIGVVYWCLLNVPFIYENIGYRFETLFVDVEHQDASAIERTNMREYGYKMWLLRPIFGYGYNSYSLISPYKTYSHNNYIELLFNGGIILFFFYYCIILELIRKILKVNTKSNIRWLLLAMIIAFFAFDYGAVSYNMIYIQIIYSLTGKFICMENQKARLEKSNNNLLRHTNKKYE